MTVESGAGGGAQLFLQPAKLSTASAADETAANTQEDGAEQREREGSQDTKAPWNNSFFYHSFHHGG